MNKSEPLAPLPSDGPPLTASPYMTEAEVAAYFRRSKRTLWNWERRGLLIPRRIARSKLYLRSDIERMGA